MEQRFLLGALVLGGMAVGAQGGIIASDSYRVGTNPAAGEYQANVIIKSQPTTLQNLGFANGAYASGTGTSQFNLIANGSTNETVGATGAGSGRVQFMGAALDPVTTTPPTHRSNARGLAAGAVTASSSYWVSHLVSRAEAAGIGAGGYVLSGFGNAIQPDLGATSGQMTGVFVGFSEADGGSLVIRHRTGDKVNSDVILADGAVASTAGVQYLVVAKIDVNVGGGSADHVSWWLNPTNGFSEDLLTSTASASGTFDSFAITAPATDFVRLNYTAENWNGAVYFDEPRLSTDLGGLSLAVPEPTGLAALGVAGVGLLVRRRRA
jgi:hypothetical protein